MLKSLLDRFAKPPSHGLALEDLLAVAQRLGADEAVAEIIRGVYTDNLPHFGATPGNAIQDTYRLDYGDVYKPRVKDLDPKQRGVLLRTLIHAADELLPAHVPDDRKRNYPRNFWIAVLSALFTSTIAKKAALSPEQIAQMLELAADLQHRWKDYWAIPRLIQQLEWTVKKQPLDTATRDRLRAFASHRYFDKEYSHYGPDRGKAQARLLRLVGGTDAKDTNPDAPIKPLLSFGGTPFGLAVSRSFEAASPAERRAINRIFAVAKSKIGAKPSAKVAKELAAARKAAPGLDTVLLGWMRAAVPAGSFQAPGAPAHQYAPEDIPHATAQSLMKAAVWAMAGSDHPDLVQTLQRLGLRATESAKNHGVRALGLANAIIQVLAKQGLPGLAALSAMRLKARQPSLRKRIDAAIDAEAEAQGVARTTLEEMAVPTLGLAMGQRTWDLAGYTLTLDASEPGKAALSWTKPDGTPMKSVPAAMRQSEALAAQLKEARALAKEAKAALATQRDRLDRLYGQGASWTADAHRAAYLDHPLMGPMSRTLIWTLDGTPALFGEMGWEDAQGAPVSGDTIALWHPIESEVEAVLAWRERLAALGIRQPFKQAHREVYLLTDTELATGTYSNRMAAHLLKQHQLRALAVPRGWDYQLMGAYDDGRDNSVASKALPAHRLTAEFWIDELTDHHDSFNDAGIWNYVGTDQVRFRDADDVVVPLATVPPLVFSEIMRDCDLFVGVASVGNDPAWLDAGAARTEADRRYWNDYAFGDLSKLAETRKELLAQILPRLNIADCARIDGRFLEVQGTRHRYRIHIGSTNIQIMPENRYLCIVPGRSAASPAKTFLPFEGDRGLSIVLSKAFMLAEDDKIRDKTILSQL